MTGRDPWMRDKSFRASPNWNRRSRKKIKKFSVSTIKTFLRSVLVKVVVRYEEPVGCDVQSNVLHTGGCEMLSHWRTDRRRGRDCMGARPRLFIRDHWISPPGFRPDGFEQSPPPHSGPSSVELISVPPRSLRRSACVPMPSSSNRPLRRNPLHDRESGPPQ